MLINNATLSALQTDFNMLFQKAYEEAPIWSDKIATTVPSTTRLNTYGWIERMSGLREWIGAREVDSLKAQSYQLANKRYEKTIGLDIDALEDDDGALAQFRSMILPEFARQVKKHPDKLIATMLQDNTALAYDGLPIFDDAHTIGTATYDNKFSLALSADNFETVYNAMAAYTDENGDPLGVYPDTLFIAPQLRRTANDILVNPNIIRVTQNVAGAENVAAAAVNNSLSGWANIVIVQEWANTPAMWVLADCSKAIKPVVYQLRKAQKMVMRNREDDPNVFENNEIQYGTSGRCNVGVTLPFLMALGKKT